MKLEAYDSEGRLVRAICVENGGMIQVWRVYREEYMGSHYSRVIGIAATEEEAAALVTQAL